MKSSISDQKNCRTVLNKTDLYKYFFPDLNTDEVQFIQLESEFDKVKDNENTKSLRVNVQFSNMEDEEELKSYPMVVSSDAYVFSDEHLEEKEQQSSCYEESDEESCWKLAVEDTPHFNTPQIYFLRVTDRGFYSCRTPRCHTFRGQCAGPTCYPRCCPCYNKHFRCCLPAIINKPQPYCVIPVKKCPPQTYVPNDLCNVCKCKSKKKKRRRRVVREVKEETVEEIVRKVKRAKQKSAPPKISVEHETEIQEPYFCSGATATQTSAPLIKLLDRKRTIMVDTPIPIAPPCLRILLRGAFEATCSVNEEGAVKRQQGCNFEELCKCTNAYIEREMVLEDEIDGGGENGRWKDEKVEFSECPCVIRGCRGSCGYRQDETRVLEVPNDARRVPCIPNCKFYNVKTKCAEEEELVHTIDDKS